jgi:stage II sporulation protein R
MKKGLSIILLITIILGGIWWSEQQQTSLRDSVLRLHVIANSDSLTDQALKIEVKNKIVTTMQSEFGAARSQQEADCLR